MVGPICPFSTGSGLDDCFSCCASAALGAACCAKNVSHKVVLEVSIGRTPLDHVVAEYTSSKLGLGIGHLKNVWNKYEH